MADKPEFVDMIREATRQVRRRVIPRVIEPVVKERSRLSHWPPERWELADREVHALEAEAVGMSSRLKDSSTEAKQAPKRGA